MKVAIVIDQVGGGGGEVFIGKLRNELRKQEEEVEVLTGDDDLATVEVPFSERGNVFRLFGIFGAGREVKKNLLEMNPDIVLILSPVAALAAMSFLPEEINFKTVYAPRYLALDHWEMISGGIAGKINRKIESLALNYPYDKIFALSENMRERIKREGAESPIDIVPIGVDTERFSPRSEEPQEPSFLFVGRFEPEKGYELFIKASEEINDAEFVMVGDDPKKLVRVPNSVEVKSKLPHSKMPEIYNDATALILPSYTEGLPRVCLESLSCGTPVIASRVGGVPDLVKNGETGYLTEPDNLDQLLEKIESFTEDLEIASEMGESGRKHIVENYDEKKTMRETVKKLQDIARDP